MQQDLRGCCTLLQDDDITMRPVQQPCASWAFIASPGLSVGQSPIPAIGEVPWANPEGAAFQSPRPTVTKLAAEVPWAISEVADEHMFNASRASACRSPSPRDRTPPRDLASPRTPTRPTNQSPRMPWSPKEAKFQTPMPASLMSPPGYTMRSPGTPPSTRKFQTPSSPPKPSPKQRQGGFGWAASSPFRSPPFRSPQLRMSTGSARGPDYGQRPAGSRSLQEAFQFTTYNSTTLGSFNQAPPPVHQSLQDGASFDQLLSAGNACPHTDTNLQFLRGPGLMEPLSDFSMMPLEASFNEVSGDVPASSPQGSSIHSAMTPSSGLTPAQPRRPGCFAFSRQGQATHECTPASFGGRSELWEDPIDPNEGRFRREFSDCTTLGKGSFSTVYKAKSRLDQHDYAVKVQTRAPPGGDNQAPLREVFVLAKIAAGPTNEHLVRYFASWQEDEKMYIQLELCAGSLRAALQERGLRQAPCDRFFGEADLVILLRQVSSGLARLHELGFAHLDVKPDNILTKGASDLAGEAHYKVADLGHVTAALNQNGFVDNTEGDGIYVAKELLRGTNIDLPKSDVFSLGLVCYEAATNPKELPRGGDAWQSLREGQLEESLLPPLSDPLLNMFRSMVAAPAQRPTCAEIVQHGFITKADDVKALHDALRHAQEEAEQQRQLKEKYERLIFAAQQQGICLDGVSEQAPNIQPAPLGG